MLISNIITCSSEMQEIELLSHRDICYRSVHSHEKMYGSLLCCYLDCIFLFSRPQVFWCPDPVAFLNTKSMQYYFIVMYYFIIIYYLTYFKNNYFIHKEQLKMLWPPVYISSIPLICCLNSWQYLCYIVHA